MSVAIASPDGAITANRIAIVVWITAVRTAQGTQGTAPRPPFGRAALVHANLATRRNLTGDLTTG